MHLHKNNQKLSELNDFFTSNEKVGTTFIQLLNLFDGGQISSLLTALKKKEVI
ncbi:MAG: hypothetical protein WD077_12465 [Bacteroidia bacterium]